MIERTNDMHGQLKLGRRQFLKATAAAGLVASVPQVLVPAAQADEAAMPDPLAEKLDLSAGQVAYDKTARSVCAPNCVGSCGIQTYVKDDVIQKVEPAEYPDPAHRRICLRGISNAMQRVYSADRVKYPMKRVGERGSGEFERISWDEAFELIHEKMQYNMDTYGPESNAFLGMTGNYGVGHQKYCNMMANTFDATEISNFGIMGDLAMNLAYLPTLNVMQEANEWEDMKGSKSIIMFGCNYAETNMQDMHFVFDAQEAGAKLVVVDPRFSRTAAKADWWIPIRPGTDAAMVLAMMKRIVDEGHVDEDYIRNYTNLAFLVDVESKMNVMDGENYLVWDEAAGAAVPVAPIPAENKPAYPSVQFNPDMPEACVMPDGAALYGEFQIEVDGATVTVKPGYQLLIESLEPWTPEAASEICEVPAEDIVKLADLYVAEAPCSLRCSQGTNRYWNGHLPMRALIQLAAITGNIGKAHANVNWAGGTLFKILCCCSPDTLAPREGHACKTLPGTQWIDILATQQPYPIKLLWTVAYGWGTQGPDWNRVVNEALPQLDFIIVSEQIMTPGARYADLVLPVTSYYEEPFEIVPTWGNMYMQVREQCITPMWEAKTDREIAQGVCEKFGILEDTTWKYDAETFGRDYILGRNLAPEFSTIDFDELKANGVARANYPQPYVANEGLRFSTASGRVEVYTGWQSSMGEELATYYEPLEGNRSEKAAEYPLTFMNCRTVYTTHSQHVQLPWIREIAPEPWLEMACDDAAARGIQTGDVVKVFNDRGWYKVKALVTPEIKPGCLNQRQGWWPKDFPEGNHYGTLLQMVLNPAQDLVYETNYAPYDNLVQVEKA